MRSFSRLSLALALSSLGACANLAEDAAGDTYEQTCFDAEYGDGTCQLSLACGVPDIDCFSKYEDDKAAADDRVFKLAGRTLATSDERYQRARRIADRIWKNARVAMAIDSLATRHLAVVVIDDPTPNAFVAPNVAEDKMRLAIAFHSGLLTTDISDDAIVGIAAHELGHLLNLHGFDEALVPRYYLAAPGEEPLGIHQPNDPRIRPLIEPWLKSTSEIGADRRERLGSIPLGGELGAMYRQLAMNARDLAGACASQGAFFADAVIDAYDDRALDGAPAFVATELTALKSSFNTFRSCMASEPLTFSALNAEFSLAGLNISLGADEAHLSPMNVSAAIDELLPARRATNAQLEADVAAALDAPWGSLRWYSYEDQADDFAVDYTRVDSLGEPGVAAGMAAFLGDQLAACDDARQSNTVPYGIELAQPHHSMCWRRDHAFRYDASAGSRRKHTTKRAPFVPTKPINPTPIY